MLSRFSYTSTMSAELLQAAVSVCVGVFDLYERALLIEELFTLLTEVFAQLVHWIGNQFYLRGGSDKIDRPSYNADIYHSRIP